MWKRDGLSRREMEYVGARWCEWKGSGIFWSGTTCLVSTLKPGGCVANYYLC